MSRWIKICGPTTLSGAAMLARSGCDAVGLNVVPTSKRALNPDSLRRFVAAIRGVNPSVETVLVSVNYGADVAAYQALIERSEASTVQLHGDEPPALARALCESGLNVIKAIGLGPAHSIEAAKALVDSYRSVPGLRLIVDARTAHLHGGTGRRLEPMLVRAISESGPFILAGGLSPLNVEQALAADKTRQVIGVDVASGVEAPNGSKDTAAVARFIESVRRLDVAHR